MQYKTEEHAAQEHQRGHYYDLYNKVINMMTYK